MLTEKLVDILMGSKAIHQSPRWNEKWWALLWLNTRGANLPHHHQAKLDSFSAMCVLINPLAATDTESWRELSAWHCSAREHLCRVLHKQIALWAKQIALWATDTDTQRHLCVRHFHWCRCGEWVPLGHMWMSLPGNIVYRLQDKDKS
jgi:hypothetical protein